MKLNRKLWLLFTVIMFVMMSSSLMAQFYNGSNMTFGKNRVQYKQFLWTFYKLDDFDVYFYRNGAPLAKYLSQYAASQLPLLENRTGVQLEKKIKFIIYNNLTDLQQTNIGLKEEGDQTEEGGFSRVLNYKVLLYFDGNYIHFQQEIRKAIVRVLFDELTMAGQPLGVLTSSSQLSIPDWFKEGYISFIAVPWNSEMNSRIADGFLSGRYQRLSDLPASEAVYAGHAFWQYIADRYGFATVNNVIRMTAIGKSMQKGVRNVLGIRLKKLLKEWRKHYKEEFGAFESETEMPSNLLPLRYHHDVKTGQPHLSPDGRMLAYTTNESGRYKIFLYNLLTHKQKKIFSKGQVVDTPVDYTYPILAWHPSGQLLAFVLEDKGMPWLYFYNFRNHRLTRQLLLNVQKVLDIAYSDDGSLLVVSAIQNGQSDLFVYHVASRAFDQITHDIASDLQPRFLPHSHLIIFSSNRISDTLSLKTNQNTPFSDHFDLFLYDYESNKLLLKRLTRTPLADELAPEPTSNRTFLYLSNAGGVRNAMFGVIDSTVVSVDTAIHYRYFARTGALSNYSRNIEEQHVFAGASKKTMLIFDHGLWKIYLEPVGSFEQMPAMDIRLAPFQKRKQEAYARQQQQLHQTAQKLRASEVQSHFKRKHFRMVYLDEKGHEKIGEPQNKKAGRRSFISDFGGRTFMDETGHYHFPKRRNYYVQMYLNGMVSQYNYNYLTTYYQAYTGGNGAVYTNPNFNMAYKIGLSDLLEDYRIVGGMRLNTSLVDNEYMLSYSNYKHRLNREVLFHRNTTENNAQDSYQKIHSHEIYYILKWPFNEALSLRGIAHYRNNMFVTLASDQPTLEAPTQFENWLGFTSSLVFDGTHKLGLNLYTGSRWKVFLEYNQLLDKKGHNLMVYGFDYRYYHRIYRTFIWASRVAASTALGSDRLVYYLGGVDNWLGARYNQETPVDPHQHYAYQALAVNMRGFEQNIRNGNSFFLINTELRLPVFQFFFETPLSSAFLRNFQLVAFGDVGTAWTGLTPYSGNNALYTHYVGSGPIRASVVTQKEPLVGGFGAGLRMSLLGYFVRADLGWGVEDRRISKPVFYLSLNLDF
jgi:hypothetical protein